MMIKKLALTVTVVLTTLFTISCKSNETPEPDKTLTENETPLSALVVEDGVLKGVSDKSLTSIVLPSNIKSIGDCAFYESNVNEITLNDGIETIGKQCFTGSKIRKINFPSSLKEVGIMAFQDCNELEYVDMSGTQIQTMSEDLFLDSSIKSIVLPKQLKSISSQAFSGTKNLKTITLGKDVTEIDDRAFYSSGINEVVIPNNIHIIGHMAFADCLELHEVKTYGTNSYSDGVLDIGCFMNCSSLSNLTLPESISKIKGYTFIECKSLKSITVPKNVKRIGELSLRTNYNVESIIFKGNTAPEFVNDAGDMIDNVFPFVVSVKNIIVPRGAKSAYVEKLKDKYDSYIEKVIEEN